MISLKIILHYTIPAFQPDKTKKVIIHFDNRKKISPEPIFYLCGSGSISALRMLPLFFGKKTTVVYI